LLRTPGEVVTWTVRMKLEDGQLTFEIVEGASETWGSFAESGALKVSVASALENLNQYQSAFSKTNSGVGFGGNRVTSLKLKKVSKLLESGDVVEDNSSQTVFPKD
jgi:hypothetical protein